MKPNIGLSDDHRARVVTVLEALLADEHVLYLKLRNAHWNVTGPHFKPLHDLFEAQYNELEALIDAVAERIRQLGSPAIGTYAGYLQRTRLQELAGFDGGAEEYLRNLLKDHETLVRQLRTDVALVDNELGDAGTADLLTGWMQAHEKMAWFLRASL